MLSNSGIRLLHRKHVSLITSAHIFKTNVWPVILTPNQCELKEFVAFNITYFVMDISKFTSLSVTICIWNNRIRLCGLISDIFWKWLIVLNSFETPVLNGPISSGVHRQHKAKKKKICCPPQHFGIIFICSTSDWDIIYLNTKAEISVLPLLN